MIVRPSLPRDIPWIVDAASEFAIEGYPGDRVDEDHVYDVVTAAMRRDEALVAVLEADGDKFAGCFMATSGDNLLTGKPQCAEVFFWVAPQFRGHGKRLLTYVENWARARGCETAALSRPESASRAGKIFEAWGYAPAERWYRKKL